MTPAGYIKKVEKFAVYLRDTPEEERLAEDIDQICNAIDQAWSELTNDDKLLVFNTARFIHDNIQPAKPKEPDKPRIQLIH